MPAEVGAVSPNMVRTTEVRDGDGNPFLDDSVQCIYNGV